MTGPLLFCISEEAKRLTEQMLRGSPASKREKGVAYFFLAESLQPVSRGDPLRNTLGDAEEIKTEFSTAIVQECRDWALQAWKNNHECIEPYSFFIADERTARDGTLSLQIWPVENEPDIERLYFPPDFKLVLLPQKLNEWYEYRVEYQQSHNVVIHLNYIDCDLSYPMYFGWKDKLASEDGVFDVGRVNRIFESKETRDSLRAE